MTQLRRARQELREIPGGLLVDQSIGVSSLEREFRQILVGTDGPDPSMIDLSKREAQVLEAIGIGLPTSDIAQQMNIAISTVETYRERLKQKLGMDHGPALVRYATLLVASREPWSDRPADES